MLKEKKLSHGYYGDAVATKFDSLGAEGVDIMVALQPFAYQLFQNAVAFAMKNTEFLLAQQLSVVDEMLQVGECFIGSLSAKVECGIEVFPFFVDIVVDGLKTIAMA